MATTTKIGSYRRVDPVTWVMYGEPVAGRPPEPPTYLKTEAECRQRFVAMVGGSSTTGIRPVEFVPSTVPGVVAWTVYKHV